MTTCPKPVNMTSRPIQPSPNSPVIAQRKMNNPIPTNTFLIPLLRVSIDSASLKRFSGSGCPLAKACSTKRYLAFRFL
ncbi:hypothetical protein DW121_04275 [Bacteroides sp. AM10-21B]|nr:hypothetical protein DXC20_04100 [Bacteroides sp. OM08-17BH]RHJ52896.1 hypothetical protein DW121_04275 [Bacteroides sp. AM10-21B]HBO07871.1 hypothetical protein [Bacteroides sp.]